MEESSNWQFKCVAKPLICSFAKALISDKQNNDGERSRWALASLLGLKKFTRG